MKGREAGLPVAVDAMGGDRAPSAIVEGALEAARQGIPVLLVGDPERIGELPRGLPITLRAARQTLGETDPPVRVIRDRPDCSIRQTMAAVREGVACGAFSAGPTGGSFAAALIELGRTQGAVRPAVCAALPRKDGGRLVLLDLGANVDCRAEHFAGFAAMGSAFARSVLNISHPRIGLLSNGGEHGKGNSVVKEADLLIDGTGLDYVGPIEPPAAFRGGCDVLVCDGFVGNVLLKTAEATAELMGGFLREELEREPSGKLGAWLATDALGRMKARLDWAAHGGGQLLGVDGVVVVGHGRSDARAVSLAVANVYHSAREELPRRVSLALAGMRKGQG